MFLIEKKDLLDNVSNISREEILRRHKECESLEQ